LFLLCLLLGEKAAFHGSLCRIGFCFQQFFEPVDIRLDDPSQIELPFPPQRTAGCASMAEVSSGLPYDGYHKLEQ
jgi:hypothetical protein